MRISRLRLHLALGFGTAFLLSLALLDVSLYAWLAHGEAQRFRSRLADTARGVADNVAEEVLVDGFTLDEAYDEVLGEYPLGDATVWVLDARGSQVAHQGPLGSPDEAPGIVRARAPLSLPEVALEVVAAQPDAELRAFRQSLARLLLVSAPVAVLAGLVAGYLLSGRALAPLRAVTRAMAQMRPDDGARLPVREPRDELDELAAQFDDLLDRLDEERLRNQRFVARAAHQIRTPLTVAHGEAELALRDPAADREAALRRIQAATGLMRQRVADLFLLAEAARGTRPPVDDAVELDALVLEGTDLMRARAQQAGHPLALAEVDGDTVRGNLRLLQEALNELVENALRHSTPGERVEIGARLRDGEAVLAVISAGPPLGPPGRGLGREILGWIAEVHGGRFVVTHEDGWNRCALVWPAG